MRYEVENINIKVEIKPSYEWKEDAKDAGISHSELEIFALVIKGYKYKEIAEIMNITHQSVKNHMHNFLKKLKVKNGSQALVLAIAKNLIKIEQSYSEISVDIDSDGIIDTMNNLFSGKAHSPGLDEKRMKYLKVWLKSHGIDVNL